MWSVRRWCELSVVRVVESVAHVKWIARVGTHVTVMLFVGSSMSEVGAMSWWIPWALSIGAVEILTSRHVTFRAIEMSLRATIHVNIISKIMSILVRIVGNIKLIDI